MKSPIRFTLLAVAALTLLWLWMHSRSTSDAPIPSDKPGTAALAAPSSGPANPSVEPVPPRTERSLPPYTAPASAAELPQVREAAKFLNNARGVSERATPPNEQGRFTKLRLVETGGKYPFARFEERWLKDVTTGAETIERSVAMVAGS